MGLQRAARRGVAALATARAASGAREHAQGVERVGEGPVALLARKHFAREGLEPQIRRIRVRDREEILRVEVGALAQLRGHEAREEVPLELGVVRDHGAARQRRGDGLGEVAYGRRVGHVRIAQPREPLHGARQSPRRSHQALERGERIGAGVEQHRAELEHLGARVHREPRRLEVDHGERPRGAQEVLERREVHAKVLGPLASGLQRSERTRRKSRPCTRGPGG
jgi:hypothetical protein